MGDTAVLTTGDIAVADAVDQGSLAVVDMSHNGDNRRTSLVVSLAVEDRGFGEIIDSRTGFFLEIEIVVETHFCD